MRTVFWLAIAVLLSLRPAYAFTPTDFLGTWVVKRVAGASDVVPLTDPNKLLGTKLQWTETSVTSDEGKCKFDHGKVVLISNDKLEKFLWGGQRITGLELSKEEIGTAFGRDETQVYYDGDGGCLEAVMLSRSRVLFMFQNGYLYLLERLKHR